jgi:flagellar hook-associated protein 3 FlgL
MVDRLSTSQIFTMLNSHIVYNQGRMIDLSRQINLGKKFTEAHEAPVGAIKSIQTSGKILQTEHAQRARFTAKSDLELAEVNLSSMKDLMDRVKELSIQGANDLYDAGSRSNITNEIRSIGETIVQLANAKSGSRYIFSGNQTQEATLRLNSGADFASTIYKNGIDNKAERKIEAIQSSVSLYDAFISDAKPAVLESKVMSPVLTNNGDLNLEIDDGNGNIWNFPVALATGDDLAAVIGKINAAFTGAGGPGSLATEDPTGYLKLDTALITGNSPGKEAKIQVLQSSDTSITNELYIKKQINYGQSQGLLQTFSDLEAAFTANDTAQIRTLIEDIESNINQLISLRSDVGSFIKEIETLDTNADSALIKLNQDLSVIQDVDYLEASVDLSNIQAALSTSIQTSSNFFSQTLSNFLG